MRESVTQNDVAKAAGVSRGLVSLALSNSPRVARETKERIQTVAESLGYLRNFGAATLASARSTLVGMVLPNLRNPYFESLVAAFQAESESRGLTVLTATASGDEEREIAMLKHFQAMRVGGIVLTTPSRPASHYASYTSQLPLIIAGAPYGDGGVTVVHIDESEAARMAVGHALQRGYRSFAYVASDAEDEATAYRRSAITAACEDTGRELHIVCPGEDEQIVDSAKKNPGSLCVIAHNDYLAIDIVSLVRQSGLRLGSDLGVLSYDNTFLARHSGFDLTSIDQQPDVQARLALDALDEMVAMPDAAPRDIVVPPTLVVRTSA